MADESLYNKASTTDRTDGMFWVQKPAATPSGYEDYQISAVNLVAPENVLIAANTASITALGLRTTALEEIITKELHPGKVAPFEVTMNAGDILQSVFFKNTGLTSLIVKAGTTLGSSDVISQRTISVADGGKLITVPKYYSASATLYVSVSGSTCDVTIFKTTNN